MKPDESYRILAGIDPSPGPISCCGTGIMQEHEAVQREMGHAMLVCAYAPALKAGKPWAKAWFKRKGDFAAYEAEMDRLRKKAVARDERWWLNQYEPTWREMYDGENSK